MSTKIRLGKATTAEEILEVVQAAFVQKLQVALQIPVENESFQNLFSGTDDLGIDYLVAVEICSWLLKVIETKITVVKVLSGGLVTQLFEYAVKNMSTRLTSNRNDSSTISRLDRPIILQPTPDSVSLVPRSPKHSAETSQIGDEQDKEEASSATLPSNDRLQ